MVRCHLTIFRGRTADRNPRAMCGAVAMGNLLSKQLGLVPEYCGDMKPPLSGSWQVELEAAMPDLKRLSCALDRVFGQGNTPITTLGRCASSIATLPVVARHHPDATIVWLDAHGDSNTPENSTSGYLGGLVLTGASGQWNTGLGSDLNLANVVLVGCRDLDFAERTIIEAGAMTLVPPGRCLIKDLDQQIGHHSVYLHLDCDVLEPGIVPTEYRVPGGISLDDLQQVAKRLSQNTIVGVEIAEFESEWAKTGKLGDARLIVDALWPLLNSFGVCG